MQLHIQIVFPLFFDRNCFKQVLKVNFPSLAASKNCDLTLLIPFCMFWSKFRTYHSLCVVTSLIKFTIVCPNKNLCLRNSNPCFPLGMIQHSYWDSQFLLTGTGRPFSCHSDEKGSYSRRLPALQYFISAAKCHPAQSIVRKYGCLE